MGINDVSRAFNGWEEPLTGTRETGSYISGRWVDGIPSSLSFEGVVQNANPKDKKVLEEGFETSETIKIHTEFELLATDKNTGVKGDIISYKGKSWRVQSIAYRFIGNYNKALAVREQ